MIRLLHIFPHSTHLACIVSCEAREVSASRSIFSMSNVEPAYPKRVHTRIYRLSNQWSAPLDAGPFLTISGDSGAVLPPGQAGLPFVQLARNSSAADNYFPIMIDNPPARYAFRFTYPAGYLSPVNVASRSVSQWNRVRSAWIEFCDSWNHLEKGTRSWPWR